MKVYLDPGKEHSHCHHVIELSLPEAQRVKVGILVVVCQEPFEQVTHRHRTVNVEHNGNIAQEDDNDVQDIPEALEVLQLVFLDLQNLLDGVVDNKEDEDPLAGHHEVVEGSDIANQFHCAEGE